MHMELYLYVIYEIMQIYPKTPSYKFMTKDIVCKQNPNTHPLGYQPNALSSKIFMKADRSISV